MNKYQRIRNRVLEKLGSKCCRCGFADVRALQIDHINGDGGIHRRRHKAGTIQYIRDIERSIDNGEEKYQLLCANCSMIKEKQKNGNREDGFII